MAKSLSANAASTVVFAEMVKVQLVVLLVHPLLNRVKLEPEAGAAVKVTAVPPANDAEHEAPQSIPAGVEVTVPAPVPDLVTVALKDVADGALMSKLEYQTVCAAAAKACKPP